MYMSLLEYIYVCIPRVPGVQKRTLDLLELELHMVVNWTRSWRIQTVLIPKPFLQPPKVYCIVTGIIPVKD